MANEAAAEAKNGPALEYNMGRFTGKVIAKQMIPARQVVDGKGKPKQLAELYNLTLALGEERFTLRVEQGHYDATNGGDVLQVDYQLASYSRENGVFIDNRVNPFKITRLKKGDGQLQAAAKKRAPAFVEAGFSCVGVMLAVVAAMLVSVSVLRADKFIVANTLTPLDGASIEVSAYTGGYVGEGYRPDLIYHEVFANSNDLAWYFRVYDDMDATLFMASYNDGVAGGFVGSDGNIRPFGQLTKHLLPFQVPEPVSGALALASSCLLVRRRRR